MDRKTEYPGELSAGSDFRERSLVLACHWCSSPHSTCCPSDSAHPAPTEMGAWGGTSLNRQCLPWCTLPYRSRVLKSCGQGAHYHPLDSLTGVALLVSPQLAESAPPRLHKAAPRYKLTASERPARGTPQHRERFTQRMEQHTSPAKDCRCFPVA